MVQSYLSKLSRSWKSSDSKMKPHFLPVVTLVQGTYRFLHLPENHVVPTLSSQTDWPFERVEKIRTRSSVQYNAMRVIIYIYINIHTYIHMYTYTHRYTHLKKRIQFNNVYIYIVYVIYTQWIWVVAIIARCQVFRPANRSESRPLTAAIRHVPYMSIHFKYLQMC